MTALHMKLLNTGNFKLDGGALFGVVPKVLWQKVYPADEHNYCPLCLRVLYIESENKKILIDTGIGEKQDEKFLSYYYLSETKKLDALLIENGIEPNEITDVVLTHLHFDHCGGAVKLDPQTNEPVPAFRNAQYWVSKPQWEWAMKPNQREKVSFLKENMLPLLAYKQLKLIDKNTYLTEDIELRLYNGHTVGQIIPFVTSDSRTWVYTGDLIPTSAHIPSSYVCGYDIQPLISMQERKDFLEEALKNNYRLVFEHDYYNECCDLSMTEKGIRMKKSYKFQEWVEEN